MRDCPHPSPILISISFFLGGVCKDLAVDTAHFAKGKNMRARENPWRAVGSSVSILLWHSYIF